MRKRLLILLLTIFTIPLFLAAQCSIIQSASDNTLVVSAAEEVGQSFTACNGGSLDSIKVMISNLSMASVTLELKIATGGNTTTGVFHTQMVTTSISGMLSIPINGKLILTKNQLYTFSVVGTAGSGNIDYALSLGDTYTGGNALRNNSAFIMADLEFSVFMGGELFVPTMSQWGLFIFGLLILNVSVFYVQRRELI